MWNEIKAACGNGQEVHLQIKSVSGGLDVLLIPRVEFPEGWEKEATSDAERATQELRAALMSPLHLRLRGSDLDAEFDKALRVYAKSRAEAMDGLAAVDAAGVAAAAMSDKTAAVRNVADRSATKSEGQQIAKKGPAPADPGQEAAAESAVNLFADE
ncbi:hypothetical protein JN531_016620 (plasmid) [Flagellatimonas centrodinii]|uniref:hypothetical protein n=1 Tax=Flagellatimonas centrodinii TaxID=2806210 RepID=UPI001FFAAC7A|nr:hypothetical protein [Flagellatimonas centrodinii]ULQ48401.1 hypothetical protein JN531_016620 [Flagellatimonas centrodinii]